jgi:ribonuclease HI
VVKAINEGWVENWKSRGWKTKGNKPAMNPDLWKRLLRLCIDHRVEFKWVKGHSGVPENERADELAKEAAMGADLPEDSGYLSPV